jgi:hypothetical protein
MSVPTSTRLPPEERQRRLFEAAEKYMRGDINVQEFEKQERYYKPDYLRMMQAVVDSQTRTFSSLIRHFMHARRASEQ